MPNECAICGSEGKLVMLENDRVVDKRVRRLHKYNALFICEPCLREWREAKKETHIPFDAEEENDCD